MSNVVGEVGGGWQVAMTTLLHERGTLGFALTARLEVLFRRLLLTATKTGAAADPLVRDRIADLWVDLQGLRFTNYRSLTALVKTGVPGPEGSVAKLHWSEANQRLTTLAVELLGAGRAAGRRGWLLGRLLAVPAAAQPRQHDRGRHLGDPAQHHRRAGAGLAPVALRLVPPVPSR